MNYIVLDLEFNQPYNFSKGTSYTLEKNCPFEIIQIGAIKLNSNFNIIEKFDILIKPNIYKRLHPIIKKLTNLDELIFRDKNDFIYAYNNFINFLNNEKNILCIWGMHDIKILHKNTKFYKLDTSKIPNKFINIQDIASNYLKYKNGKYIGLKKAVKSMSIPSYFSFHNALNDAIYAAKILITLKNKHIDINIFEFNEKILKIQL